MKEVFVRVDRCLGCRSCQIACAVEHSSGKNLFAAIVQSPLPRYRVHVEKADAMNIPLTCRHCDPAACADTCIAGSMVRDERGAVVQREDRCVGCWTCLMVCPYGVVSRERERKVAVKCDRCPDRDVPACVSACPTKALVFSEAEDFSADVRKTVAGIVAKATGD